MRKITLLVFALFCSVLFAQTTYVPDDNFEQALIDLGYDTVLDDYVTTSNIASLTSLSVSNKSITDLTGIEAFTSLESLSCQNNMLQTLDVTSLTNLTNLYCQGNSLTNLDISKNTLLDTLVCDGNAFTSLDFTTNTLLESINISDNALTSIDLSNNTALVEVVAEGTNIVSIDVSMLPLLEELGVNDSDELVTINIKSTTNTTVQYFEAERCSKLICVLVDDVDYAINNWTDVDTSSVFTSTSCNVYVPDDNLNKL